MLKVTIGKDKLITNYTNEELLRIKEDLTITNPAYIQAKKYSRYKNIRISKNLFYYTQLKNAIIVPRGYEIPFEYFIEEDNRKEIVAPYPQFKLSLRDTQKEAVKHYLEDPDKGLIVLPTGKGKAQPLDTKILTPKGYVQMRDLKLDDKVIGQDGKPYTVNGIFPQGVKDIYKVSFKDGSYTYCCDEHLWNVRTRYEKKLDKPYKVLPLKDIMNMPLKDGRSYNLNIPIAKPVEFEKQQDLPLDPYVLGLLIGDGCLHLISNGKQANCYFSSVEEDLVQALNKEINNLGGYFYKNKSSQCQYIFTSNTSIRGDVTNSKFFNIIRGLNLTVDSLNKFIPKMYLFSSIEDRQKLLKGLFDTDGCVRPNGSYLYSTSSLQLANDIMFLCRSLGYRPIMKTKNRIGQQYKHNPNYYRKSLEYEITIPTQDIIYNSKKHKTRHEESISKISGSINKNTDLPIISIEKVGKEECQCISVDSKDHTYLCDDFIVTHNTILGLYLAYALRQKCVILVHKDDLVDGWTQDCKVCFGEDFKVGIFKAKRREIGEQITIATIQTLNRLSPEQLEEFQSNFGMIICDETHHISSSSFDLLHRFSSCYKIGLTATPERADGLTDVMNYHLGGCAFKYEADENDEDILPVEVIVRDMNLDVPIYLKKFGNKYELATPEDEKNPSKLIPVENIPYEGRPRIPHFYIDDKVITNSAFSNRIIKDVYKEYLNKRSIICFFRQKKHVELYKDLLVQQGVPRDQILLYYGDAKESKESMKELAESRKALITLATYSIATEGTNVKAWEVAFLVSSVNDGKNVEQAIGRIRRSKEGKIKPVIAYDYVLNGVYSIGSKHYTTRQTRYKKLGFKINRLNKPTKSKSLFSRGFIK